MNYTPIDETSSNADVRTALQELQEAVYGTPQPIPKAEWNAAADAKVAQDWEPVEGYPGVFRDPKGIWQWAKKGEVPKAVLDRFPLIEPGEELPTPNEEA